MLCPGRRSHDPLEPVLRDRLRIHSPIPMLLAVFTLLAAYCPAVRAANTQIPGKVIVVRDTRLMRFVGKPQPPGATFTIPAPGSAADPTLVDGLLSVVSADRNSLTFFASLPRAQWEGLGSPAGSKGFKYKGAGTGADPCRVVLVKPGVIKTVCKDDQLLLSPPPANFPNFMAVKLSLGPESYSAYFGSGTPIAISNDFYKARSAPACVPPPGCCNGYGFHAFTTAGPLGDCGDVKLANGAPFASYPDLTCSGLYTGGGANAMPLPVSFPTQEQTITAITSCTGQTATLGPATSAQTGDNRTCSDVGCLFGPPVPVPNAAVTPVSTCLRSVVSGTVSGTLDCDTGQQNLALPLAQDIYLTGDTTIDPGGTIPGIQPCPVCVASACVGGPNNSMFCVGSSGDGTTTHDCPSDPADLIGTLPLNFSLTSGTVTWTASSLGTGQGGLRVFAGFCRDPSSLSFQGDPVAANAVKCFENGMAVTSCTSATFSTCRQQNNGAFGPGGGLVQTITGIGRPQDGIRCAPTTGALASVFAIGPTFDSSVDAVYDLPGPAAVVLPVVGALCPFATTCPLQ